MRRLRLVLVAAILALVAAGAAWLFWPDRLSAEEQRLVGAWQAGGGPNPRMVWDLFPDRRWQTRIDLGPGPGCSPWYVRGGSLVLECERSPFHRALRGAASLVGISYRPAIVYRLEWTSADELQTVSPDGISEVWTRATGAIWTHTPAD
ncbi:MAG TPA: hypothetical protein VGF55_25210 [Gemmataceae bacterium]|jgi:hypothetical protein